MSAMSIFTHNGVTYHLFYKGVFSQFHESQFVVDGVSYNWAEQYMMAEKARLFGDNETLAKILAAKSPKECKRLGRKVAGYVDAVWNAIALEKVAIGNFHKFTSSAELKETLLSTGDEFMVEASFWDKKWGSGKSLDDTKEYIYKHSVVPGGNLLGQAIMMARSQIREM